MVHKQYVWVFLLVGWVFAGGLMACNSSALPTRSLATPTISFARFPTISPPLSREEAAKPTVALLPTPAGDRFAPADVPACKGAQNLEKLPFWFSWAYPEEVFTTAPLEQWTYYRCTQSLPDLVAFFRQTMTLPIWEEHRSETTDEGTLIVFDNGPVTVSVSFRTVYLWMLPDPSNLQVSYLVAAWWNGPRTC